MSKLENFKIMELYEQMKDDLIRSNFRNKKGIIMCLGHYDVQFADLERSVQAQMKATPKTQGIPAKKHNAVVKQVKDLEKENLDLLEAMACYRDE